MSFLESAKETFFWKSRFDSDFKMYKFSVELMCENMVGKNISKILEEKRLSFRENTPRHTFSSSETALKAFVDFCDDYQSRTKIDLARFHRAEILSMDLRIDLMHLSEVIAHASYTTANGRYVFYPSALDSSFVKEDWRKFHQNFVSAKEFAVKVRKEIENVNHSSNAVNEVLEEIDDGVLISSDGKKVWKSIERRMTAWEISSAANVPLSETVFWLRVFKRINAVKTNWHSSPIGPFYERAYLFDLPEQIADALM